MVGAEFVVVIGVVVVFEDTSVDAIVVIDDGVIGVEELSSLTPAINDVAKSKTKIIPTYLPVTIVVYKFLVVDVIFNMFLLGLFIKQSFFKYILSVSPFF